MEPARLSAQGDEREKTSAIRLMVSAESWTGAELRGLPRGGSIRIEAESDGPVRLLMADRAASDSFPDVNDTLFDRQIEGSMVAEITLPQSGDYVLIADNRTGSAARQILLALRGRSHDRPHPGPLPQQFQVLQTQIEAAFDLDGLTLRLDDPGPARPGVIGRDLVVGQGFIRHLEATLPDPQTTRGAILFAILHALAGDWLSDGSRPETRPEALAAALMILFNQIGSARRQADHFADTSTRPEPVGPTVGADPLSAQTARSVQQHLRDPQALLKAMQGVVFSRMRPAMLDRLEQEAPDWADPAAIRAARQRLSSGQGG